ncbi:MAG: hypothetical protein ACOYM8_17170, partial [Caulobacterales bacterium]
FVWFAAMAIAVAGAAATTAAGDLEAKRLQTLAQTDNMSRFLATDDLAALRDKPSLHVPYPSPERLAELARDPTIRKILPRAILPPAERNAAPARLTWLRDGLLWLGPWLVFGALALALGRGLEIAIRWADADHVSRDA